MLRLSLLESEHQCPEFCCTEQDINTYFNTRLKSDVSRFVNAAYVLWDDDDIVGFFTLSQHAVNRDKQRNKGHFSHIPTTLLGQFALNKQYAGKKYQGVKYSALLLDAALRIHVKTAKHIGSTALMLNPINEIVKEKFYDKIGLFKDYESADTTDYMYATTQTIIKYLNDKGYQI